MLGVILSALCGFSTYCIPPYKAAYYSWQMLGGDLMRNGLQMGRGTFSRRYVRWSISFPKSTGVEIQPVVGDVNDDGIMEILVPLYFDDPPNPYHRLYAINGLTGDTVWRFDGDNFSGTYWLWGPAIIADVDGDDSTEVLIFQISRPDKLYILRGKDGSVKRTLEFGSTPSHPLVGDIDGDGKAEIVLRLDDYDTLFAYNGEDFSLLWEWHRDGDTIKTPPAAGDVDGDGDMDVVFGLSDSVIALDGRTGTLLWSAPTLYGENPASVVISDVDGDGDNDVVEAGGFVAMAFDGADGSVIWSRLLDISVSYFIAVHDMDGDSVPEVLVPTRWNRGLDTVYALSGADGSVEWKYVYDWYSNGGPEVADVDPSSGYEVVFLNGSLVTVVSSAGNFLWEMRPLSSRIKTIADVDGDGCVEIVVGGGDFYTTPHLAVIDDSSGTACPLGGDGGLSAWEAEVKDTNGRVKVFSPDGRLIFSGTEVPGNLRRGIYFVVEGRRIRKLIVP